MHIDAPESHDQTHDWQSMSELSELFFEHRRLPHPTPLKLRAAGFIRRENSVESLTRPQLRRLLSKAKKMKKSTKKNERARGLRLEKEIQQVFNLTQ